MVYHGAVLRHDHCANENADYLGLLAARNVLVPLHQQLVDPLLWNLLLVIVDGVVEANIGYDQVVEQPLRPNIDQACPVSPRVPPAQNLNPLALDLILQKLRHSSAILNPPSVSIGYSKGTILERDVSVEVNIGPKGGQPFLINIEGRLGNDLKDLLDCAAPIGLLHRELGRRGQTSGAELHNHVVAGGVTSRHIVHAAFGIRPKP